MSRYESASHVFYRCQYHIVWTPKYRYKILKGSVGKEVYRSIYVFCHMKKCKVVEHPFRIIKCQFGFVKARYRGLKKNDSKLAMLFALANVVRVDQMLRAQG